MVAANTDIPPTAIWGEAPAAPRRRGLARLVAAIGGAWADRREDGDEAAIVGALSRLSERRLGLLGMRHATLPGDVRALMDRVRRGEAMAEEVIDLLDRSPIAAAARASAPPSPRPWRPRVTALPLPPSQRPEPAEAPARAA